MTRDAGARRRGARRLGPSLASLLLLAAPPASAAQRFALLIGANPGWSNDRPLRHADSDAARMRDALVELGGVTPDRAVLLSDPDTAEVRSQLRRLAAVVRETREETSVLFYYSGHADDRYLHLRGAPLSHAELLDALRALPATVRIGILDACKSGSILAMKGGRPAVEFRVQVVDELSVRGLALLTSSGADELSQESAALAGSIFTHHLVSGLRGAADANGDGRVTLSEAYQYAYARTAADSTRSGTAQHPAFRFDLRGRGDLTLTESKDALAAVELPPGPARRYVVVDAQEVRLVAEMAAGERPLHVALAPGEYRVKRVLSDRLEVAPLALARGATVNVTRLAYAPRPLAAGLLKGRPDSMRPEEVRVWRGDEGMRLLAAGDATAALQQFDAVLAEAPYDLPALRGRARALVRLAEAWDRLGEREQERQALRAALATDPSLSDDLDFQIWYKRLREMEETQFRADAAKSAVLAEIDQNPRLTHTWGLGFDLFSSRGFVTVLGTAIVRRIWFPSIGLDLATPALDLSARLVPGSRRWSPFFGIGGHLAFAELGLGRNDQADSTVMVDNGNYTDGELFGRNLHAEGGVQYFGPSGFSVELGLGVIFFERATTHKLSALPMPIVGFDWYF